jgi:hypothetical protein
LERLRQRFVCVSFTILSLSLVVDVSRRNQIAGDAVIACEMLRVYKTQPEAYRREPWAIAPPLCAGRPNGIGPNRRILSLTRPAIWSSTVSPNSPMH